MNKFAISFFIIFYCFSVIFINADEIKSEITQYSDKIFYEGNNNVIKNEIEEFKKREINFKAQTNFKIPLNNKSKEEITRIIEDILTNVQSFNTIVYTAKNSKKETALFKNISIVGDYIDEFQNRIIVADLRIVPFRAVKMQFKISRYKDFIIFRAFNIDKVKYWILTIVPEEKLTIFFAAESNNDVLDCYGLGVADTGTFLFFRNKIQEEFIGRAEAIINWIYELLKTKFAETIIEEKIYKNVTDGSH